MDTRQLAAFCAVVERRSFSQAAERLGVTQPAVSLQIRSLEQRLGRRLLDRSGRRVEPTEAGLRLYASAQRLLALEESLLDELAQDEEGGLTGTLDLGASTGPGGTIVPLLLCEFQEEHPEVRVRLTVSDTQTVVERVAAGRQFQLGAHEFHGDACTLQRTCDESEAGRLKALAGEQIGQNSSCMRGLRQAQLIERRFDAALQTAFDVPVGFAVAHVVNGRRGH